MRPHGRKQTGWRRPPQLLRLAVAALAALALSGCTTTPQSIYDVAGPVARRQLDLLNFTTMLALVVGGLMVFLIVYIVWRFRDRGQSERPPQIRGNRTLQIIWTVIPLLIVAYKAVPTVADAFYLAETPAGALPVQVVGHQWWWEFHYPDLGITTANELHIPVGKPIDLILTSADVNHSFWVPRLAGKIDAIPNRSNKLWLQADTVDVFWGQCAELCGNSHAHMGLRVVAESQADYDTWVRKMKDLAANPVQPSTAVAVQGQELFMGKGTCYSCHSIDGTKAQGKVGPNLTGVALRATIAAGKLVNTPENLARWIQNPQGVKPAALMSKVNLTADEIQALVAYLGTQK